MPINTFRRLLALYTDWTSSKQVSLSTIVHQLGIILFWMTISIKRKRLNNISILWYENEKGLQRLLFRGKCTQFRDLNMTEIHTLKMYKIFKVVIYIYIYIYTYISLHRCLFTGILSWLVLRVPAFISNSRQDLLNKNNETNQWRHTEWIGEMILMDIWHTHNWLVSMTWVFKNHSPVEVENSGSTWLFWISPKGGATWFLDSLPRTESKSGNLSMSLPF